MAYFDTKEGSLEQAIKAAFKISEKLDAVNPKAVKKKFDDRKDKDIDNDGDVDSSDEYLHKRRKAVSKAMKSELGEKAKIEFNDDDKNTISITKKGKLQGKMTKRSDGTWGVVRGGKHYPIKGGKNLDVAKAAVRDLFGEEVEKDKKEAFEYGTPEATKNSLKVTPGQSSDDWDKQVNVMQQRQTSMRETLAKMWGVDEGHNPFKKEEEEKPKKEGKTMTGKPMTKVSVNPDMKEKKDT